MCCCGIVEVFVYVLLPCQPAYRKEPKIFERVFLLVAWKQSCVTGVGKKQLLVLNIVKIASVTDLYDVAGHLTRCSGEIIIPHYKPNIDYHGVTIAYLGMKINSGLIWLLTHPCIPSSPVIRDVHITSRQVESC